MTDIRTLLLTAPDMAIVDFSRVKGIAIYCPGKGKEKYMSDAYAPTRFALKTKWDDLLSAYFAGAGLSPSLFPLSLARHDCSCVPLKQPGDPAVR